MLEILLVIVIIAVTAALVVPSISSLGQGSVVEEAKRLRVIMRLAMEETQLSGRPLRWLASEHGWSFENFNQDEQWSVVVEPPLHPYQLPDGVRIVEVQQGGDFSLEMTHPDAEEDVEAEPVIGMVLLLPDGTTSQSDIRLVGEGDAAENLLEIRPGPAGIRLQKR